MKNICFQTRGGINHDFGGLDRVTEILADFFEDNGYQVYYLSQIERPNTDNRRQYYLPNKKTLTSSENITFYNKFIEEKKIDILINQEGNVNIILPLNKKNKAIIYITALHFNPNYITEFHFINKFNKMNLPSFVKKVLLTVFKIPIINNKAFSYLHKKLESNYFTNAKNSDKFILLSNRFNKDLYKLFKNKKSPNNIVAINNPIILNKKPINFSKKKKKLLYVGRLECGMKQLDKLLNNWKQIAPNFPNWTLHLVGSGPDEMLLKKMVEIDAIPRVFFEGTQNPKSYYEEASIFCFSSSSSEGWGMVLVEAQMYGCVPIAFESYSSITDIIKNNENGILIPPYSNKLYKKNLEELMSNSSFRIKLAENAIESVKKFDINTIGKQWVSLFGDVRKNKKLS